MPVSLRAVAVPPAPLIDERPVIPAEVFERRAQTAYARAKADWLVVYADREHFGNMAFLTDFEPRFEEAFLLLGPGGARALIVGNECESYAALARLPGLSVLRCQTLSLMGQDRSQFPRLGESFAEAGLKRGDSVALVGWKYLEAEEDDDPAHAFFVPAAYVRVLQQAIGAQGVLRDATAILMHPETGLRSVVDADQIAAFEFAATRCSAAVWNIVCGVREGDIGVRRGRAHGLRRRPVERAYDVRLRRSRQRPSLGCAARRRGGFGAATALRRRSVTGARCRRAPGCSTSRTTNS